MTDNDDDKDDDGGGGFTSMIALLAVMTVLSGVAAWMFHSITPDEGGFWITAFFAGGGLVLLPSLLFAR